MVEVDLKLWEGEDPVLVPVEEHEHLLVLSHLHTGLQLFEILTLLD